MRVPMFITAAAVACLSGSCAQPLAAPGADFSREVAGRTPGPAQSCVLSNATQNIRVLDAATLAYGWGRTVYINRLGGMCPGITPTSTLIVEAHGAQYCRGDRVRGREMGATIPGPACPLGDWVPYRQP